MLMKMKKWLPLCRQCDKRILCAIIIIILFNFNFFILFIYYFKDIPDFMGSGTIARHNQHLRKSPYVFLNGSVTAASDSSADDENKSDVLPDFSYDNTEFIMGAIVERHEDADREFHITVFALNRFVLSKGRTEWGPNRVRKEAIDQWRTVEKKAKRIYYHPNGTRDVFSNIHCQISNEPGGMPYLSPGVFLPNALSIDPSFNNKIDIVRCKMQNTTNSLPRLTTSNQYVQVQLLRRRRSGKFTSLLNFSIAWNTRRAGFMQRPADASFTFQHSALSLAMSAGTDHAQGMRGAMREERVMLQESLSFSRWDPWQVDHHSDGYSHPSARADVSSALSSRVYLCVSGKTTSPFVDDIAQLLEFMQHHLLLGVWHVFLSVRYAWDSENMHTLLLALRHFIDEGLVSVTSQASDGFDRTASTKGLAWGDDFLQLYHCTLSLYMTKGLSGSARRGSYMGVWSLDDFLLPSQPHESVLSLLEHPQHRVEQASNQPHTNRDAKLASKHVPCYVLLRSRTLRLKHSFRHDHLIAPWLGARFAASFHFLDLINHTWLGEFNFLLPVEQSFQLGIPSEAVCQAQRHSADHTHDLLTSLEHHLQRDAVTGEFSFDTAGGGNTNVNDETRRNDVESFGHAVRAASSPTAAVLHKFSTVGPGGGASNTRHLYNVSSALRFSKNRYITDYFPKVLEKLKSVNLDLIVALNLPKEPARVGTAVEHWPQHRSADEESVFVY